MALLVVFFLRCIYLDYRRRLVVIGGCANISDDLNIPKNSRVSGNVSSNLRTVFDGYQSLKSLDVSMVSCHHYQKVRN